MLQRIGSRPNELAGGGWRWVEVEMMWVEVGARFSNTLFQYLLRMYLTFLSGNFCFIYQKEFPAAKLKQGSTIFAHKDAHKYCSSINTGGQLEYLMPVSL